MGDYIQPDAIIVFQFNVNYSPPLGDITFLFGDATDHAILSSEIVVISEIDNCIVEEVHVVSTDSIQILAELPNVSIDDSDHIVSIEIESNIDLSVLSVEEYFEVDSSTLANELSVPTFLLEIYFGISSANIDIESESGSIVRTYFGILSSELCGIADVIGYDVLGTETDTFHITVVPEIISSELECTINTDDVQIGGGQIYDLPAKKNAGHMVLWSKNLPVEPTPVVVKWDKLQAVDTITYIEYADSEPIDITTTILCKSTYSVADCVNNIVYGSTQYVDLEIASYYNMIMDYTDVSDEIVYSKFKWDDPTTSISYYYPPKKDFKHNIVYGDSIRADNEYSVAYGLLIVTDVLHHNYWGFELYTELCSKYHPPVGDITLSLGTPYIPVLDSTDIHFVFRPSYNPRCHCDHPYTSWQDVNNPLSDIRSPNKVRPKDVYYMRNTAIVRRITSNMEVIDCSSISMSIDRDSWSWSFNLGIVSQDSIDMIKPYKDVYTDLEIIINGWFWKCRVEQWTETTETYGFKSWSVTARSLSVELADPYYTPTTIENNSVIHGGQLIDSILLSSGWDTEWGTTDYIDPHTQWAIPANTFCEVDTNPIKAVQTIAGALGFFINTHRIDKKILLKPYYKTTPWRLNTAPLVAELTDAICYEMGRANKISSMINSIIVSGDIHGVVVNAVKDGEQEGSLAAPMVIDKLITTREAGAERARSEISSGGFWITHTMRLFSLSQPNEAPGLLSPADVLKFNYVNGTSWIGIVNSVQVTAEWTDSGLQVSQSLQIDEYQGAL